MRALVLFLLDASAALQYAAHSSCPCLTSNDARLYSVLKPVGSYSPSYHEVTLPYAAGGGTYNYPVSYGVNTCAAHDAGLAPFCNGGSGSPAWCARPWCYVDSTNCRGHSFVLSEYHPYNTLHYSTETCASTDPGDEPWTTTGGHTAAVLRVCSALEEGF